MPITIPVGLDTAALESQFKDLEALSRSWGKAVGESFSGGAKKVEKAAESAAKGVKKAGDATEDAAKKAEKSAGDAAKGLEDLGDAAGLPVDMLKKLAGGFAALGNPVTLAIVGIGAVALGMVAAAAGIVEATQEAEKLAEAMKPLRDQEGFGISKSSLTGITSANDALRALSAIADQFIVSMGAEFAPTVERVSVLLVKLGLMALDAFNTFASGKDVLHELAVFMVEGLIGAATGVVNALFNVVDVMAEVARAVGQGGLADQLKSVTQHWKDFKTELAEDLVAKLGEKFVEAEEATGSYDERAKKLIETIKNLGQAHKDTKKDVEDLSDGVDKLLEGWSAGMGLVGTEMVLTKQEVTADAEAGMAGLGGMTDQALELTLGLESTEKAASKLKGSVSGFFASVGKFAKDAAASIASVASGIANIVSSALGFVGFDLKSVLGAASAQETRDPETGETTSLGPADTVKQMAAMAKSIVAAIPTVINAFISQLPGVIKAVIAALPAVVQSIASAIPKLFGLVAKLAPKLIDTVISLLPGLLIQLINLLPGLIKKLADALPELVSKLLAALPSVIIALTDALPSIIYTIVGLIPDLILAVVEALPNIIAALVELVPTVAIALIGAVIYELLPKIPMIIGAVVKALFEALVKSMKALAAAFLDAIGFDKQADKLRQSYNDAPSLIRAGPQGMNARVGAGDYFLAGRNPQALLEQALNGALGAGAAPVMAGGGGQVNMAWQHRAFDGFFVRHAQLGGQTSGLFKTMNTSKDARGM